MLRRLTMVLAVFFLAAAIDGQVTGPAARVRNGTSDPATCLTTGPNIFFNRTTGLLKVCTATNTWTALGSSLSATFLDSGFTLQDDGDVTKQGKFQLSAVATGQTRTLTWPNADSTLPIFSQAMTFAGPTAARTVTFPDANFTAARIDAAQSFTGNQTFAGVLLGADAGVSAPEYSFTNATASGLWNSSGVPCIAASGVDVMCAASVYVALKHGLQFAFSSAPSTTAPDTFIGRAAAATVQLGAADSATPVAQTITAQGSRGGTDTNVAGADLSLRGSLGTGNAAVKAINVTAAAQGTGSGSTQHTAVLRQGFNWFKALANNTVTTVANVTDANNTSAVVIVNYGAEVFNGTDVQYEVGSVSCGVNNKAGVFSQNTCTKYGNTQGVTAGTLAVTWTITAANPALLQVNVNSSLASITTERVTYSIQNLTQQAVTEQ